MVVFNALSAHFFQAEKKYQRLEHDIDQVSAWIDKRKFHQVIDNLIGNAIKYSEQNTTIRVSLKQYSMDTFRFIVQDEGQGIAQEEMHKLFTFGEKLSAKPTGDETSHGIGLSVVREIVNLHGGKVWAESEGKGKGATFIIEIPLNA
jgi:signal transduction histidine kinase